MVDTLVRPQGQNALLLQRSGRKIFPDVFDESFFLSLLQNIIYVVFLIYLSRWNIACAVTSSDNIQLSVVTTALH